MSNAHTPRLVRTTVAVAVVVALGVSVHRAAPWADTSSSRIGIVGDASPGGAVGGHVADRIAAPPVARSGQPGQPSRRSPKVSTTPGAGSLAALLSKAAASRAAASRAAASKSAASKSSSKAGGTRSRPGSLPTPSGAATTAPTTAPTIPPPPTPPRTGPTTAPTPT